MVGTRVAGGIPLRWPGFLEFKPSDNMNLLFWVLPGAGKTAFANHLAQECRRRFSWKVAFKNPGPTSPPFSVYQSRGRGETVAVNR